MRTLGQVLPKEELEPDRETWEPGRVIGVTWISITDKTRFGFLAREPRISWLTSSAASSPSWVRTISMPTEETLAWPGATRSRQPTLEPLPHSPGGARWPLGRNWHSPNRLRWRPVGRGLAPGLR